jgi:hypothetical protein
MIAAHWMSGSAEPKPKKTKKSAADCPPTAIQRRFDRVRRRTLPRAADAGVQEKIRAWIAHNVSAMAVVPLRAI